MSESNSYSGQAAGDGPVFRSRRDAGDRLSRKLERFQDRNPLVLAIPKGGVEVGTRIAGHLGAGLSVVIVRKLPFPGNPESGFGALAEDGSLYLHPSAGVRISRMTVERIMAEQRREIARRIELLRGGNPLPDITGRTVILTDDGIAMGSTMQASIRLCRNRRAGRLVVAVPVAGVHTARAVASLVDELVVLTVPSNFRAVAQVYADWYDVSDQEAVRILREYGVL